MLNKLPKILTYVFLITFLLQLAGLVILLALPEQGQAINFNPHVDIGVSGKVTDTSIGEYIMAIYNYAIGIIGILAVVVMMVGGVIWITAGGNAERVGSAKAWIGAALTGLVLTLSSWMILNTINPELIKIKPIKIKEVTTIIYGCCEKIKGRDTGGTATKDQCEENEWKGKGYAWDSENKTCEKNACCVCKPPIMSARHCFVGNFPDETSCEARCKEDLWTKEYYMQGGSCSKDNKKCE